MGFSRIMVYSWSDSFVLADTYRSWFYLTYNIQHAGSGTTNIHAAINVDKFCTIPITVQSYSEKMNPFSRVILDNNSCSDQNAILILSGS